MDDDYTVELVVGGGWNDDLTWSHLPTLIEAGELAVKESHHGRILTVWRIPEEGYSEIVGIAMDGRLFVPQEED